jgi:nitrogen fixation-related uncharacterized protein
MDKHKLILPVSILLGFTILGGFYYAGQVNQINKLQIVNKQQSSPEIKQIDQQASSTTTKTPATEKKITPKVIIPTSAPLLDDPKKDLTPYVDLKVNEQDGPITIKANSLVNVSWTSANVVSCSSSINDKPLNGRETINVDSDTISPFTIRCLTSNGMVVSDSVVLNITDKTPYNPDPYGVLSGTGNAYSPEQLDAIDCAYYGRNCPTIDVRVINN